MDFSVLLRTLLSTTIAGIIVHFAWKILRWLWGQYRIRRCLRLHWPVRYDTHWFWGNMKYALEFQKNPMMAIQAVKDGSNQFSHGFTVFLGPVMTFLRVHNEKIFKVFLGGSEEKFPKADLFYTSLKPWLENKNLLMLGGREWHRHRRLLSNSFHFDILRSYTVKMNECSKDLVKKWEVKIKDDAKVEVFEDFSLMALDTIMKCLMGVETHCQENDSKHNAYVKNIYKSSQLISKRLLRTSLLHHIDWIYYLSNEGKQLLKSCKEMREYSAKVIEQRKKEYAEGAMIGSKLGLNKKSERHYDFIDVLLQAQDSTGKHLTDVEISDEVNTFMFEGHDTTTSAISWTCYCLAQNPDCQEKCYEEIVEVLGQKSDIELDDLPKLKYLTLCIKEGMRMYPPVAAIARKPTSEIEVENRCIGKDTIVLVSILGIHHQARLWPDPGVFDPLRFTLENSAKRDSFSYVPFSAGLRGCIGQNFAMNELKICLAHVLRRFKLAVDTSVPVIGCLELLYRTRTGLHLLVTERTITTDQNDRQS